MPPRRKRRPAPSAKQYPPGPDAPLQERMRWINNQELERRTAAIRAIQAAETESVLSRLRLVQSYVSKELQGTCALQYFQENLPNLSVVQNEKHNELELKWKDRDSRILGNQDDKILRASIASLPNIGGLQFSGDSVQKNFIESTSFDFNDFAWSDLPKDQMAAGAADALQTPGAVSNRLSFVSSRLSFGMTPKTVRLPKNGEMLLSVHGSPLGVYKEDNLAAICESGNGSGEAAP